jgi:hypothetical protein
MNEMNSRKLFKAGIIHTNRSFRPLQNKNVHWSYLVGNPSFVVFMVLHVENPADLVIQQHS